MDSSPATKSEPVFTYSGAAIWRGLFTAAVVSSLLSIALLLVSSQLYNAIYFGYEFNTAGLISQILLAMPVALILGLPVAGTVMALIGRPLWAAATKRGRSSFADAMVIGLIGGAIVAGVELLAAGIGFVVDTLRYNPEITSLRLAQFFIDLACTIGIGALTGLAARAAAGPPRAPRS